MLLTHRRLSATALVVAALFAFSSSAHAQHVTFTNIRDAVPFKFFNPLPDSTQPDPANPNTLIIGFESGRDSGNFTDDEFRASTQSFGNRVAADVLSFNIVAPTGYYVSSITYEQVGTGIISRIADARGTTSWVISGTPASLGVFREVPSLSRTATFTDSRLTVVPVSISTSLFVYAPPTSGDASVEVTSARVIATVAPLETGEEKKAAVIDVAGFSGPYDGVAHGASGTAVGVNGEDLSSLLSFGQTYTDAPGGIATWTFAGNNEYNAADGTATITINPVDATINVSGFSGTYDGAAHGATGTAAGVNDENLSDLLSLGATFVNVPGGTANWTFGGTANYNAASGTATVTINKAIPILSWPQPTAVVAGTVLTTTQLNASANVEGTFIYTPPLGTVVTTTQPLTVLFTPADTLNYDSAEATVTLVVDPNTGVQIVNPGPQTTMVGEDVRLRLRLTGGTRADREGIFTAAGLPAGLEMRAEGVIRGEPTTVGTSEVIVTFTHNNVAVSTSFGWTIVPRTRKGGKG